MKKRYATVEVNNTVQIKVESLPGEPEVEIPLEWEDGQIGVLKIFDDYGSALRSVGGNEDYVIELKYESHEKS